MTHSNACTDYIPERTSIIYFGGPDKDAVIQSKNYRSMVFENYLKQRFEDTFSGGMGVRQELEEGAKNKQTKSCVSDDAVLRH